MVKGAVLLVTLLAGQGAGQGGEHQRYPPPEQCRVVLEDLGDVGYRIADAQQLAERALTALKRRAGRDAVIYEGALVHAKKMKRMLGTNSETQIQDDQIAYLNAATGHAPFRVTIKFGKKGKSHFVTVACRRATDPKKKTLAERTFTAARWDEARDQFAEGMGTFCPALDPPPEKPQAEAAPKKPRKEFVLPPVRR